MTELSKERRSLYRSIQPWVMWGLAASFFLAAYFARVDPSIIANQLMSSFDVGALAIGSLSAFYYYPYIAVQIPVGSMVDRFGSHRLLTLMSLFCGLACLLFSRSHSLAMLEFARALMGFTSAFAFVGALKLATLWFEPRRLGLLAGLTQGMGMLGAALGEGLFSYVVARLGWRGTIALIGWVLVGIAVLIWLIVRDRPANGKEQNHVQVPTVSIVKGLKMVLSNPQTWINGLFIGLLYAPTQAFAELWGPSFLHVHYGMSSEIASIAVGAIFLGSAIGGPLLGFFSDKMQKRKPLMYASVIGSLVMLVGILFMPRIWHVSDSVLIVMSFIYGFFNVGFALSYAVASEINPLPVSGLSMAFANMASITIGAFLQPLIGWIIQMSASGAMRDGVPVYTSLDYRHAMLLLPITLILCLVSAFFLRETHCKRQ